MDDASRFAVAKALGLWSGCTPETHQERADQVMEALRATPPPPGWRPLSPDDGLLRTLLPDCRRSLRNGVGIGRDDMGRGKQSNPPSQAS
jgi:hypothetical protein